MRGSKNPGTPHLARTWIKIKWLGLASLRQEAKQKKSEGKKYENGSGGGGSKQNKCNKMLISIWIFVH